MDSDAEDVPGELSGTAPGEECAAARLLPLAYDRLRGLAGRYFQGERCDHTLEPTALVHEAFVKLADYGFPGDWSRAHFFAVAAKAMRQVLADHARARKAAKRGGDQPRVSLTGLITPHSTADEIDLIALDAALEKMTELFPEQAYVVELRFLGGLEVSEVAEVLGVSTSTVERRWRLGRAWLRRELSGDSSQ